MVGAFEESEMFVGEVGGDASAWCAHEIALLDEERLADLLDGARFFADGCGDGVDAHRSALEFLDDSKQDAVVHVVEAVLVDVEGFQTYFCDRNSIMHPILIPRIHTVQHTESTESSLSLILISINSLKNGAMRPVLYTLHRFGI